METLHYYFNRVEDEVIKAKLFANTYASHLSIPASSLEDAIYRAFPWGNTPEGNKYWNDVADSFAVLKHSACETVEKLEIKPKPKRGRPKKKVA
jgi:hypothetical protein